VPFSFEALPGSGDLVRGVVDCLVVAADGSITVLEFKTGQTRGEHQIQAGLYGRAIAAILGAVSVSVEVLYS
jgi:RecB family exonuclease